MAASTAGGQVAAAVSRACDKELSQDGAEAQVPKWEEPGTVESQEITPNCLLQQGVLLIWFLQGPWRWSKFLFSLLYRITKTGKDLPPPDLSHIWLFPQRHLSRNMSNESLAWDLLPELTNFLTSWRREGFSTLAKSSSLELKPCCCGFIQEQPRLMGWEIPPGTF